MSHGGNQLSKFVSISVARKFNDHWQPQTAAIDGVDLTFIYNGMIAKKPKQIVEIGCCTGLSTALMALMLDEIGPGRIDSYDMLDHVYFDPTKEVGYLINELAPDTQTKITVRTGKTSVDVAKDFAPNSIDFCFIDANHAHPWPTLDTLCVLPLLRPGGGDHPPRPANVCQPDQRIRGRPEDALRSAVAPRADHGGLRPGRYTRHAAEDAPFAQERIRVQARCGDQGTGAPNRSIALSPVGIEPPDLIQSHGTPVHIPGQKPTVRKSSMRFQSGWNAPSSRPISARGKQPSASSAPV